MACRSQSTLMLLAAFSHLLLARTAEAAQSSSSAALPEIPDSVRRKPDDLSGLRQSITLAREIQNETKYLGEQVVIYCDIVGTPVPNYQWYKDGAPLPDGGADRRIRAEVTLYGAVLRIRQLRVADSGSYRCLGSNPAGRVDTTGFLIVYPTRRPSRKDGKDKPDAPSDVGGEGAEGDSGAVQTGFCQRFKPNVCRGFLGGRDVFVRSNMFQFNKEAELLHLLQRMADIVNDTQCTQPVMETLCRYNFPECHRPVSPDGAEILAPIPRRLCRTDCEKVTQHWCRENFEKLRASFSYYQENTHSDIDYLGLLPNCAALPAETTLCVSLAPELQSTTSPPQLPQTSTRSRPAVQDCYNASDATGYRGPAARSRSGRVCLPWSLVPGYGALGDHNQCRSLPVAGPSLGVAGSAATPPPPPPPWCFVSGAGEWEDCGLPPCSQPPQPPPARPVFPNTPPLVKSPPKRAGGGHAIADGNRKVGDEGDSEKIVVSVKEILPVVISLAVLLLVAIVLTIVFCVYRRSAKAAAAADAAAAAAADDPCGLASGKAMRLAATKKSVSDVRLDLQCTTPLLTAQEFPITQIRFGELLGESAFGRVYKGELIGVYSETSLTPVAIKCLNGSADAALKEEFSQELQQLAGLSHPNLTADFWSPCCLAMELPPHGDLHEFLAYRSPRSEHSGDYHDPLSQAQMFHMATQVASAVEYLTLRCLVHRDIAARNIQLGDKLECKLSDLGQCRDIYAPDYYLLRPGSRLPIRWMPPEATLYGQFSTHSDAYSFGVLLWEIWSYGLQPYYGYSNSDVIELVRKRQLLACPPDCPPRLYSLMLECWTQPMVHRVSATEICNRLRQLQAEVLVELSTSSQGSSGNTNSTAFSGERPMGQLAQPASQRVIPVPVPQLSPPGSSAGSAGSTTAYSSGGGSSSMVQSYQLHGPPQRQPLGLRQNFHSTMAV
uniref:Ig-like domain-containing protein n=1 Tax=Macrostomum lignano TaxID=282301 RepID=A0A1I8GYD6_9PLAT